MIGSQAGTPASPSSRTPLLRPGDKVGLVACSDALTSRDLSEMASLGAVLDELGLGVVESPKMWAPDLPISDAHAHLRHDHAHAAPDPERARALEDLFYDPQVKAVFDVSGGDLAGGVLTHLDLDLVAAHPKPFFGYSDLTVLVNALRPVTPTYLWTIRNLARSDAASQLDRFVASVLGPAPDLFALELEALQGELPNSPVVGGNLRCLLKLAGTPHFPELPGRLLALESSGASSQATYAGLHQLHQMGAFGELDGVLLGSFTALERDSGRDAPARILFDVLAGQPAARNLPIARADFGHGPGSRAIRLGEPLPR